MYHFLCQVLCQPFSDVTGGGKETQIQLRGTLVEHGGTLSNLAAALPLDPSELTVGNSERRTSADTDISDLCILCISWS